MKGYAVRAERWAQGWEVDVDGVGVTQVRTLDQAPHDLTVGCPAAA